ncbi:MAG TPA: hypothetical protein VGC41_14450 [Kofleriaceae bacterium]
MRISWLSPEDIAMARAALTAGGATYESHFAAGVFTPPAEPPDVLLDWAGITEHVARAERISEVVREHGLVAARERFSGSGIAIEAAVLASAAHEDEQLGRDEVIAVLRCPIDVYVFYAHFLELLVSLSKDDLESAVKVYEEFVTASVHALASVPHGGARSGAVRDGLADLYVSAGHLDRAEAMFEKRHEEDHRDVAVALSASRAFLAAGSASRAVRWLGIGAARAQELGRGDLAKKLQEKQDSIRKRLS